MATRKKAPNSKKRAGSKTMKKSVQSEKKEVFKEIENIQRTVIGRAKKATASMKTSLLKRSKQAEKWHKSTAKRPLAYLAKVNRFETAADDMMAIQAKTIGHCYDLARTVVVKVDDITGEILTRAEKRIAA
jgi:hypothetical protein